MARRRANGQTGMMAQFAAVKQASCLHALCMPVSIVSWAQHPFPLHNRLVPVVLVHSYPANPSPLLSSPAYVSPCSRSRVSPFTHPFACFSSPLLTPPGRSLSSSSGHCRHAERNEGAPSGADEGQHFATAADKSRPFPLEVSRLSSLYSVLFNDDQTSNCKQADTQALQPASRLGHHPITCPTSISVQLMTTVFAASRHLPHACVLCCNT